MSASEWVRVNGCVNFFVCVHGGVSVSAHLAILVLDSLCARHPGGCVKDVLLHKCPLLGGLPEHKRSEGVSE